MLQVHQKKKKVSFLEQVAVSGHLIKGNQSRSQMAKSVMLKQPKSFCIYNCDKDVGQDLPVVTLNNQ